MNFGPAPGPTVMATIFPVGAGVGRAEIPALCADLAGRLRGRAPDVVICELAGPGRPGVATVEAIARLRLTAQRHGWRLHVRDPSPDLLAVVVVVGRGPARPPRHRLRTTRDRVKTARHRLRTARDRLRRALTAG
jgi:hypothetical protein